LARVAETIVLCLPASPNQVELDKIGRIAVYIMSTFGLHTIFAVVGPLRTRKQFDQIQQTLKVNFFDYIASFSTIRSRILTVSSTADADQFIRTLLQSKCKIPIGNSNVLIF
jgi:uncharacterized membrane protein